MPKALAIDLRDASDYVVTGSRFYPGARPSSGGVFSKTLLCAEHEALTSKADTYGVSFIRRAEKIFQKDAPDKAFEVPNPDPALLQRFVATCVLREVLESGQRSGQTLGPYYDAVAANVFDGEPLPWPLLVARARFHLTGEDMSRITVHPYRVRLKERNAWTMMLCGLKFFLVCDKQGIVGAPHYLHAEAANPVLVLAGIPTDFRKIGIFKDVLRNMGRKPGR